MEWDLTPKPASESEIVLVQAMELTDANLSGNVHGGVIMRLVDTAAGISAHKHSGGRVVTVAMDEMSFLEPIYIGDVVTVRAMVNDVGRTSMEVGVRVDAERKDLLVQTMGKLSSRFHQVFVITHAEQVKDQFPASIEVRKVGRRRSEAVLV